MIHFTAICSLATTMCFCVRTHFHIGICTKHKKQTDEDLCCWAWLICLLKAPVVSQIDSLLGDEYFAFSYWQFRICASTKIVMEASSRLNLNLFMAPLASRYRTLRLSFFSSPAPARKLNKAAMINELSPATGHSTLLNIHTMRTEL